VLESLARDLAHLVAGCAELLVLHARRREEKPDDEADAGRADGDSERIPLGRRTHAPELLAVRDRLRGHVLGAAQLRRHRVLLLADVVADAGADVRLVAQRVDLIADTRAGLL
jgi:hypothetical protein